jgi:rhodanese-related sulfurtransferase
MIVVREREQYEQEHRRGAVNIPLPELFISNIIRAKNEQSASIRLCRHKAQGLPSGRRLASRTGLHSENVGVCSFWRSHVYPHDRETRADMVCFDQPGVHIGFVGEKCQRVNPVCQLKYLLRGGWSG